MEIRRTPVEALSKQLAGRLNAVAESASSAIAGVPDRTALELFISHCGMKLASYIIGTPVSSARARVHGRARSGPGITNGTPHSHKLSRTLSSGLAYTATITAPPAVAGKLSKRLDAALTKETAGALHSVIEWRIERISNGLTDLVGRAEEHLSDRKLLDTIGRLVRRELCSARYVVVEGEAAVHGMRALKGKRICIAAPEGTLGIEFTFEHGPIDASQLSDLSDRMNAAVRHLMGEHKDTLARRKAVPPIELLLGAVDMLGKSADLPTLRFSLERGVESLLGTKASLCWWSVDEGSRVAELDHCDCPTPERRVGASVLIQDDELMTNALQSQHTAFVEGAHSQVAGHDRLVGTATAGRLALVLRSNSTVAGMVVFTFSPPRKIPEETLCALDVLARHAGSRVESMRESIRLGAERRILMSLGGGESVGRHTGTQSWSADFCSSLLVAFRRLEGAAYLVRDGDSYRCMASSFRQSPDAYHSGRLDFHPPAAVGYSPFAVVHRGEPDGEWNKLVEFFGAVLESSDACTPVPVSRGSADLMLLLFHLGDIRVDPVLDLVGDWLLFIRSLERTSSSVGMYARLETFTSQLLYQLEQVSFLMKPSEIAERFSGTIAYLTGCEFVRFYTYSESAKKFNALTTWPFQLLSSVNGISLQDLRMLDRPSDEESGFVVALDKSKRSLWDAFMLDDSLRAAHVVGITQGKKISLLVVIGHRGEVQNISAADDVLLGACRMLSNLISASSSLTETIAASHFSSGFLGIISRALRSRDGMWSFGAGQIADMICGLVGNAMQQHHALLYSSESESPGETLLGKWSRGTQPDPLALSESMALVRMFTTSNGRLGGEGSMQTLRIDSVMFPSLDALGVRTAATMHAGDPEGPLAISMLLLGGGESAPSGTELHMVSASLEATRLILESRLRRSEIDWTLNAMRSELAVANNLSSTFEMSSLLDGTVKEVADFLGCEVCLIELIGERGDCNVASVSGRAEGQAAEGIEGDGIDSLRSGERRRGFSSIVSETGSNISVQGARGCGQLISFLPPGERAIIESSSAGAPVKSLCGAPISFAGKLLGMIVCMRTSTDAPFRRTEIGYIESVAALMSTAIENSRNVEATFNALSKLKKLDTLRSNFSSIAAHELRTPLTSIRVYIELMRSGKVGSFNDQEMKNIENLLASISELTDIINNMLEFTRMEAMLLETELSPVSLYPIVEEICAQLSPAANVKSIRLEFEADRELKMVRANAPLAKRVINNLVGNAIKFTPEGGRIIVRLRDEREGVLLVVEDTGKGIPADDLPFIFDRFHVVDSSILHSRTGFRLGLPISKLIVERHGGRIWADSEVGKGSKFYVLLPVKQGISTEEWLAEAKNYIH